MVAEVARQREISGRECGCVNCDPKGAAYIIARLGELKPANFGEIVSFDGRTLPEGPAGPHPAPTPPLDPLAPDEPTALTTTSNERKALALDLLAAYKPWFEVRYGLPSQTPHDPAHFFSPASAKTISKLADELTSEQELGKVLSEPIHGLWAALWHVVVLWREEVERARRAGAAAKKLERAGRKEAKKAAKESIAAAARVQGECRKRARVEEDAENARHIAEAKRRRRATRAQEAAEEAEKENLERQAKKKASSDR